MARTVAVGGSERLDAPTTFLFECRGERAFEIAVSEQLDRRQFDSVGSEQIVDMPVSDVVLTVGDPAVAVDA